MGISINTHKRKERERDKRVVRSWGIPLGCVILRPGLAIV
jgi:hypothetical protein